VALEFGLFGKKARKSPSPLPLSRWEREKKQFGGWIVILWCDNPTPKPLKRSAEELSSATALDSSSANFLLFPGEGAGGWGVYRQINPKCSFRG